MLKIYSQVMDRLQQIPVHSLGAIEIISGIKSSKCFAHMGLCMEGILFQNMLQVTPLISFQTLCPKERVFKVLHAKF